jgi:2-polyprenyl-6-methoxyphenol hydroxylase-like FAD-dependent oxidoreductase
VHQHGKPAQQDCVIAGASFAGLACAIALARCGHSVTVLEDAEEDHS